MVSEHQKDEKRGILWVCCFQYYLGQYLASSMVWLMTTYFDTEAITQWAAHSFFGGGVFGLVNLWVRRHLSETPAFLKLRINNGINPCSLLCGNFKRSKKKYSHRHFLKPYQSSSHNHMLYFPVVLSNFYGFSKADVYFV